MQKFRTNINGRMVMLTLPEYEQVKFELLPVWKRMLENISREGAYIFAEHFSTCPLEFNMIVRYWAHVQN